MLFEDVGLSGIIRSSGECLASQSSSSYPTLPVDSFYFRLGKSVGGSEGARWNPPLFGSDMTTKMKGLLKGLRYISQIFEDGEEEQEMQIGYPTDVKHVAHIGWDGPSTNSPSWMNEFRSPVPVSATAGGEGADAAPSKWSPPEMNASNGIAIAESPTRDTSQAEDVPSRRASRHQISTNGCASGSPGCESSTRERRQSRRHQSTSNVSMGSPTNDTEGSTRHGRRLKSSATTTAAQGTGCESPGEAPVIPKQRRKKTNKSSAATGSSTRSRSKTTAAQTSFPDPGADDLSAGRIPLALPAMKPVIREEEVF